MQSLEERVRNAIVKRKIEFISAKLQEARYQEMYRQMFTNIAEEIYQTFAGTPFGRPRLTSQELIDFTAPLLTPPKIRENVEIVVADSYVISAELETELQNIDPKIFVEVRRSIPYLRSNVSSQTKIVRELTEIARARGVEYAATQEAEDQAVQRVFPNSQDYSNFVNFGYDVRQEVTATMQRLGTQRKAREIKINIPEDARIYLATIVTVTTKHMYTLLRQIDKQCALDRIPIIYGN